MTYLEIVNDVLKRLREPTVSSVNDTDYSAMIGVFVNDAKRDVENAHDWNALWTVLPVITSNGTGSYTLTGSGQRFKIKDVMFDDKDLITQRPRWWINQQLPLISKPAYYSLDGVSNGDSKIEFFPTPDAAYNIEVHAVVPQSDLINNTDATLVEGYLISLLAYAKAIAERGEDAGLMSSEAAVLYSKALSEAIAIERNRYNEEVIWEAV
jgi:hypothetical protein